MLKSDEEYWKGAIFLNQARYDIPAFIEFIKAKNRVEKVTVVTHSVSSVQMSFNLVNNQSYFADSVNLWIETGAQSLVPKISAANHFGLFMYRLFRPFMNSMGWFAIQD